MILGRKKLFGLTLAALGTLGACGSDTGAADVDGGAEGAATTVAATQNACPAEGCLISFGNLAKSGDEIEVTWEINYSPDTDANHIHIYWDNYSAAQVSNDATDRGVTQGKWVPTDGAPTFVTSGAVSTVERGDSTTLCVVAGDRDHNVIDEDTEVCEDVSDYL